MFADLYYNLFSLGSLIPTVFVGLVSLFLFAVPRKSKATLWLSLSFLFMVLFYAPYFPASSLTDSSLAFHRWFTVPFVLLAGLSFGQFALNFPERTHPRLTIGLLVVQLLIAVGMTAAFYYQTIDAPRIFRFDGHYWDFAAEQISKQTGLVIIAFVLTSFVLFIWRGIVNPEVRYAMIGMGVAFALSTFLPGVTNVLSRDGALNRDYHQIAINLSVVIGFFSFTMIYINTTEDRTSVMAKIVGISLAVFLVVLQAISFLTLQEKDTAYDEIQARETALILARDDYRPENLRYIARYEEAGDLDTAPLLSEIFTTDGVRPDTAAARSSYENAIERARILRRPFYDRMGLEAVLAQTHPEFAGYRALLLAAFDSLSEENDPASISTDSILEEVDDVYRAVLYTSNKLKALPDDGFQRAALNFLNRGGRIAAMDVAISDELRKATARGGALKSVLMSYYAPFKPIGNRHYRLDLQDSTLFDPFVSFFQIDWQGDQPVLYEVGYSYRAYREFIHQSTVRLVWILGAVLVVVLVGFRLFFHGALLQPLAGLVGGVRRVNMGDLDVELPVRVEDELGFLGHSFNGMVRSIRAAKARLQEYADELEEKVEARTAELKNTLDEVQTLKQQQDGDYFLTSLLIKPLNSNRTQSESISSDFLVKQKKTFEFRKRNSEIGGDLCMLHQVQLKGRPYTVFLNADAMGKSMQGAGGALVLGSVFESMVTRTQMSSEAKEVYPERWLKNAFIELHKIFESFEGSMLISLVLGLVDEQNGFMYYINAEHPFSVVYRNGKAQFVENELMFRKLGTTGMEGMIHIPTFQLEPGDVFIAGSDGRDDIMLGIDPDSGERIINEDEGRFLTVVEEAHGDLERMHELLQAEGEITDDLSLLSIVFTASDTAADQSDDSETQELVARAREAARDQAHRDAVMFLRQARLRSPSSGRVLKDLAVASYNLRDFNTAAKLGAEYLDLKPGDTEMVYMVSLARKKLRNFESSADLAERVRLRDPRNFKNLLHLTEVHMLSGNLNRAQYILTQVREIDPENSRGTQLQERLEQKQAQKAKKQSSNAFENVN